MTIFLQGDDENYIVLPEAPPGVQSEIVVETSDGDNHKVFTDLDRVQDEREICDYGYASGKSLSRYAKIHNTLGK